MAKLNQSYYVRVKQEGTVLAVRNLCCLPSSLSPVLSYYYFLCLLCGVHPKTKKKKKKRLFYLDNRRENTGEFDQERNGPHKVGQELEKLVGLDLNQLVGSKLA